MHFIVFIDFIGVLNEFFFFLPHCFLFSQSCVYSLQPLGASRLLCPTLSLGKRKFVAQSCPTLYNFVNCSLPGSSVHEIFQARILKWVAIPFSRDLPDPGIEPRSRALQTDSLLSHQGSPLSPGVCSNS